jgi:uncharacterized damage-inducible protein DinB
MMKLYLKGSLILFVCFGLNVLTVSAQSGPAPAAQQTAAAPAAPTSGFRAEFLTELDDVQKKLVSLAEAIPAEKYTYRPADGVRSVSEVVLHVAGGNFGIPRVLGIQPPEGINPRGFDKSTTEKAKVLDLLKQSFEHARQAALKTPDADLDKTVKLFGRDASTRRVFFQMTLHMHEHLGQLIAYARSNGVVPPWSQQ